MPRACVPIVPRWEEDGQPFLLIRRRITDPQEKAYSFVFAEARTTLQERVQAIGARWPREEEVEQAKDMGLDHYGGRSFLGWYRHVTLVMLAAAYLTGICSEEKAHLLCVATPPTEPLTLLVLPLTVPEVRHLLGQLLWPAPSSVKLVLAWSWWRRWHRSCASYFHTKRRLHAG